MGLIRGIKVKNKFFSDSKIKSEAQKRAKELGIRADNSVIGNTAEQQYYFIIGSGKRL
tara:strand:- start:251 stop:424 length:174 start_codon:yes stop_codon:yes gene_type:complete